MEKVFILNGEEIKVQDYKHNAESVSFNLNGKQYHYSLVTKAGHEMVLDDGARFKAAVGNPNRDGEAMVMARGREAVVAVAGKKMKKAGAHAGGLKSPMPGKIFKVIKNEGEAVAKGDVILILEAMKMEHAIRSDKDGTVKKLFFKTGELVQGGVILADVE